MWMCIKMQIILSLKNTDVYLQDKEIKLLSTYNFDYCSNLCEYKEISSIIYKLYKKMSCLFAIYGLKSL